MNTVEMIKPVYVAVNTALADIVVPGVEINIGETATPDGPFPCVTFSIAFPQHGAARGEGVLEIKVDGNEGTEQIIDIIAAICSTLERAALPTTIGKAICLADSTPSVGHGEDGTTLRGVQNFRIMVHT